ncbi:MAG: hypothetical protein IKL23_01620 [Oscillospiraceae bacterium]|nr:hypothetical protein [Oscillospiraceae bacterium]
MRTETKRMATCAMMTALSVVLMLLGGILELGMYACPLFVSLAFVPIGEKYGRKYHLVLYAASAILCFLLVPNWEENLMFAGFFGWYPIVRPALQKLPLVLRWAAKLLLFNAAVIAMEWLLMTFIAPQAMGGILLWVLLALGNVTFLAYDALIPRTNVLMKRLLRQR